MGIDFRLVSEFANIHRRSFALAAPAILNPTNANPLVMGEWLELAAGYLAARGSGAPATVPSFPVFSETGRYETQALGKVPLLYMNSFEADTKVFDGTGIVSVGQPVMVTNVTYASLTRRGLALTAGGGLTIGYVTRLPAENAGFLRFIRTLS